MLKNKIFLGFLLLCGLFAACEKKKDFDPDAQLEIDKAIIKKYLDALPAGTVDMTADPSGLSYQILSSGTTPFPKLTDSIQVSYKGRVLGANNTFEDIPLDKPISLKLDALMPGWQIALPKIAKGGQIRMIIPSTLAYKNFSQGTSIPPYSILDYTVTLVDINKKTK